jgi:hypothetical protein
VRLDGGTVSRPLHDVLPRDHDHTSILGVSLRLNEIIRLWLERVEPVHRKNEKCMPRRQASRESYFPIPTDWHHRLGRLDMNSAPCAPRTAAQPGYRQLYITIRIQEHPLPPSGRDHTREPTPPPSRVGASGHHPSKA